MKLGNVIWACDRCAAEKEQPADSKSLPFGWQRMEFPPNFTRDVCPKCVNAFRIWYYGVALASELERAAR